MTLDLSCPDWRERLKSGRSLVPDLQLPNEAEGHRAVGILNRLRLFDVPGTPTMAEAGGEWFRRIVFALFASLDPVTKARLIREVFLLVPKKQNKTTGGALLMLTALLMNRRPRAPFLLTGPVQKTADDAFAAAEGAIALDDVLAKKLHVRDHLKTIIHRETGAKLEIMTFDPDIATGKKVAGGLIDELHVLGKSARAAKAMVQLRGGMVPFPEAFLFTITTQSDEPPAGVFDADLTKAREIRDGKRTGATLPVLYEWPLEVQADPEKPWRDPAMWPQVLPNLGLSVRLETLVDGMADAEAKGEEDLRVWASQHLNIQIGVGISAAAWAGAEHWEKNGDGPATLEELLERSDVAVVGIDGGGLADLLGLGVMGREIETGRWLHWGRAWAKRCLLRRNKQEQSRLLDFAADGDLVIVEDESDDDIEQLVDVVETVDKSGLLDRIGVDQAGITSIVQAIVARGIKHDRVIGIPQGWRLSGSIKAVERKLAARSLRHGGQRLMAYAIGSARAQAKGNAVLITKDISGAGKIDPLMALFDCGALMAMDPKPRRKKYQMFVYG